MVNWSAAQKWEAGWWGKCLNTYGEEEKQILYAHKMGLKFHHDGKSPYVINVSDKSIVDIGGGPISLLLKCVNLYNGVVVDPLLMPEWAQRRYISADIEVISDKAENLMRTGFHEAWIYNCLQHTEDPELVIKRAQAAADIIRIFEWINTPSNEGHPNTLTIKKLNQWLDGEGKVEVLKGDAHCSGQCYYGIFPT